MFLCKFESTEESVTNYSRKLCEFEKRYIVNKGKGKFLFFWVIAANTNIRKNVLKVRDCNFVLEICVYLVVKIVNQKSFTLGRL